MDIVNSMRKARRTVAALSLATLIASFFAIGVAQAGTFEDVTEDAWYYSYVEDLVAQGVISVNTHYRPGDLVNRAEMAKLVVEAFDIPLVSPEEPSFNDVAPDVWYYDYVETAAAHAIVGGYKDEAGELTGYFGGPDPVTREQAAKMVVLGAPLTINTNCGPSFPDVPQSAWSYDYVETLYVNSVIDGMPDGNFARAENITRAAVAKVMSNAMYPVLRPCGGFSVDGADALSETTVEVCYTGAYDETSGLMADNYAIVDDNDDELAVSAVEASSDDMCVVLTTDAQDSTKVYDVTVTDVTSADDEELLGDTASFNGFTIADAGALTVAVDGSTPDEANIPLNGANIPYSVFAFTASDEEAIHVDQLVVSRAGLGFPGDFTNVKLYVDGVQKGGEKTVSSSTNTATFNLTSDPIEVPATKTVLVELRADMAAAQNSENQLCLATSDDVNAMGASSEVEVTVGGDFSLCGNVMTTTSATVGNLTYTVTQPSTADVNVGDTDVSLTKVRMDMAGEDVEVNRVTFKQTGSADSEDFGNPTLWLSGSPLDVAASWEGDFLTFDFEDAPLEIAKGNSKTVELHTDIVGGLGSTANFDIYRDWHIEGEGMVYHYGVNVAEAGASITPAARNIVGGNIAFSASANNPVTGDVKKGANDHDFTRFNISTGGDGVTVRKLSLTVNGTDNTEIDDVKIWTQNADDDWYVVAGPNDITAALPTTVSFTDTFEVPAATTQEFMITGDITNGAVALNVYDIDVASVNLGANTELEYLSDGTPVNVVTEVTGGVINGNVMTVATPSLDVTLAATPGNKSYVRNTVEKDLVAFDMKASSADDLRVTSVVVSCVPYGPEDGVLHPGDNVDVIDNDGDGLVDGADVATGACNTAFQSLKLYEKDGSTLTQLDPSARSMAAGAAGAGTATFSLNHTIEKSATARLLVRGDLSSSATQDGYELDIKPGDVSAEDTDSSAATVNVLPDAPAGSGTNNRIVGVAPNGTITNQGVTGGEEMQARIVAGGSLDEPTLKVKFSASELEAWYVKKLEFDLNLGADTDVSKIWVKYLDNNGDPQTADGTFSGGVVNFEGLNIYIPAGDSQTVDVTLDMGNVSTGEAVAGDIVQVLFDATAPGIYQAIGASSATAIAGGVDVLSNEMRLAKSFPMVESNDGVSTAMSTNSTLYSVDIAADGTDDIAIKQLCYQVVNGAGGAYTAASAKLYRDGEGTDLVTAGEVTLTEGAALCGAAAAGTTYIQAQWVAGGVGGEDEITAGTTKTYVLKGGVTGAAVGDKVTTTLMGDNTASINQGAVLTANPYTVGGVAEYFVWSDLSATPHLSDEVGGVTSADFLDGYLVDGLANVNAHEVKF